MDVIDENNKVIFQKTRSEIHKRGLWHRGVHVLVFNGKGELLLQRRSSNKEQFPDCLDISLSEHLQSGEMYDQAALRGLKEELGIIGTKIEKLLRFKMVYGHNDNNISEIYKCNYDGVLNIDKEEVDDIKFLSLDAIKNMLTENENIFAFWSREILKWFFGMHSKVEKL